MLQTIPQNVDGKQSRSFREGKNPTILKKSTHLEIKRDARISPTIQKRKKGNFTIYYDSKGYDCLGREDSLCPN